LIRLIIIIINYEFEFIYKKTEFLIFLLIGLITKRAQFPFIVWLPMAIAAPTPISSLVHSSTLVTAGVYLIIRFNFLFINYHKIIIMCILSLYTIVLRGLIAINETDIKILIAYSTMSQISLISLTLIIGIKFLSFFLLLIHSVYKSLSFIRFGILIKINIGMQDRKKIFLSSINYFIPTIIIILSMIAINGFPFIIAFLFKDGLSESIILNQFNIALIFFTLTGCVITVLYSSKLLKNFLNSNKKFKS